MDSNLQTSVSNNALPQSPTNNLDVSAATYLGASEDDYTNAVDISADGNFVIVGGSLNGTNLGAQETELLGGGDGTIIRYDSQTNQVISITRLPGKVLDLQVSNGDSYIAVAYEGGIAVLNADATEVKWSQSLSNVSRIAISDGGKVGVVEDIGGGDKAYLFNSNGEELQQWNTNSSARHFNDIAVTDQNGGMVIATGYDQKAANLQVAFTQAWSYEGENLWKNYDFNNADISQENLMADTRGTRIAIGGDGKLYASYKINGGTGSSILSRDPNDLSQTLTDDRKIENDSYNTPTNVGSIQMVWYGRYDLNNGDLIKGQSLLGRLPNGKGNSVNIESITAAEDGTVILGGGAAFGIANRNEQTIEGQPVGDYLGLANADGYIAIISSDFQERLSWTPISDGGAVVVATRDGKTAAVTTTDSSQITHNAIQDTGGGNNDGYLLVIGGNDAPPGTEPDTPQDENPVDEGDTSVDQDASDNFPQENENTVNPDADDNSSEDNPQPILEGGSDNPDSVFPIGLLDLTQIDLDGDNQIDEKVSVNFSEITSEAVYNNSFGYYAIANINGAVKDTLTGELINPEEQGYAKAALNQRVENLELRRDTETQTWELSGGVMLVPYFIANGTVEEWMETNSDNQSENLAIAYFSFISANPDNKEHIRQVGDELRFEDLFGGGDNDFDDFVTRVNIPSVL